MKVMDKILGKPKANPFVDPADVVTPPPAPAAPPQTEAPAPAKDTKPDAPDSSTPAAAVDDPLIKEAVFILEKVPTCVGICIHDLEKDVYYKFDAYVAELINTSRMMVESLGGVTSVISILEQRGRIEKQVVYVDSNGNYLKDPLPDAKLAALWVKDLNARIDAAATTLEAGKKPAAAPPSAKQSTEDVRKTLVKDVASMSAQDKKEFVAELLKQLGMEVPASALELKPRRKPKPKAKTEPETSPSEDSN